jgi:excisionase family DNA binding protein
MNDYLTTHEVEDLLSVDRVTIYRMLQDNRLKGNKIGSQWRFLRSDVERFLRGEPETGIIQTDSNAHLPIMCLQAIQNVFSAMSNLGSMLLNMQGELVTQISGPNPICHLILKSTAGWDACLESWHGLVKHSQDGMEHFTCHAGLNYLGAPVMNGPVQKALFWVGPLYWQHPDSNEETQRIQRLSETYHLSEQDLMEDAHAVPVILSGQREQLEDWLAVVIRAMETAIQERSGFIERLEQIASLSRVS